MKQALEQRMKSDARPAALAGLIPGVLGISYFVGKVGAAQKEQSRRKFISSLAKGCAMAGFASLAFTNIGCDDDDCDCNDVPFCNCDSVCTCNLIS